MLGANTSDYDFALPTELIAQTPPAVRGESRLMVVDRATGTIEHRQFQEITEYIPPHDLLVRNTTKVMRARLLGERASGAPAEILLLKSLGEDRFEAMVHPGNKLKPGRRVHVADALDVEMLDRTDRGTRIVRVLTTLPVYKAIERYGHVPLPPYIARDDTHGDIERYQTVYAQEIGSVAAPTAGLHFTEAILDRLRARGVRTTDVVLHVGAGTFKPVDVEDPAHHVMHEEWYHLPEAAAHALNETRARGAKVWAVGTTSVRTLESAVSMDGTFAATSAETRIFIRPPYQWRAVDHLLTNFHLPKSTLIMLVAAFAGYELTMHAYQTAIAEQYRFFSYGDAMLVI